VQPSHHTSQKKVTVCIPQQVKLIISKPKWRATTDNTILGSCRVFNSVTTKECVMFNAPLPEVLGPVPRWKEELNCVLVITLDSTQPNFQKILRWS